MPASQNAQNRFRLAPLFADADFDPARGRNEQINQLFNANGISVTEPAAIKSTLSNSTLQGPGLTTILAMINGELTKFYAPFTYVPSMGAASTTNRDKHLAIMGELMARRSFILCELPATIYRKTVDVVTYTPDHMSAYFVANPTATSVGPFEAEDEAKDEMEKIKSRNASYLPHSLGVTMSPECVEDPPAAQQALTVAYFWITVYPAIVAEGTQDEHKHLIQYFQVAATLRGTGGTSVVDHPNAFDTIGRDEGVYEAVDSILDRVFPNSNSSGGLDSGGFHEVAKEIGALAASNQKQAEEAEERRVQREAEKYSLEKVLGRQALKRLKSYNGLRSDTTDSQLAAIPLVKHLADVKSTKDSDLLKALQEALEEVYENEGVDPEDAFKATPQIMKLLLEHWERIDTDSLVTGVGANLFLHGPKNPATTEEQIQLFHSTLAATNAPDPEVLKKLYAGEIYVPTIADVGCTLRHMMWLMMTVLVPGHPHVKSLKKVINKWSGAERKFTLDAMGDDEPQRGIYLIEALNVKMNQYWAEQRISEELIPGWDGLKIFKTMKDKHVWRPELSPKYRADLKLDQFLGVYGSHIIKSDGGN